MYSNPDYPVESAGGFLQHTYQSTPDMNAQYYWNGVGCGNSFGCAAPDSRRNAFNPVNPFNQFGQVGMPQPQQNSQAVPEYAVQAFGTYPPSAGQLQNAPLNAMVDSRRNMGMPNNGPQNNPWAPAQNTTPQTASVFNAVPTQQPTCNPFSGMPNFNNPYYPNDPATAALYAGGNFSYDRRNSWDNYYTNSRQITPPTIDWRAASMPQYQQAPQQQLAQAFNQQSYFGDNTTSAPSWSDIASQNWSAQR